jgi:hypothetical protein
LGNPLGLLFFACASSAPPPNHLVPVFSCEKALNIKKIIKIEGLGLGCPLLTFKALHGMAPKYMVDLLVVKVEGNYLLHSNDSLML